MSKSKVLKRSVLGVLGLVAGGILVAAQGPPPAPDEPKNATATSTIAVKVFGGGMQFDDKLVKGAPFSAQATTVTDQTLADGNHIHHQNEATLYRDSQGRTRRETTLAGLGPWSATEAETKTVVMIHDPVAGVHYVLHPDEHRAIQMPLPKLGGPPKMEGKNKTFFFADDQPSKVEGITSAVEDQLFEGPVPPPPPAVAGGDVHMFIHRVGDEQQNGQTESLGTQVIEGVKAEGTRITSTIAAGAIGNDQPIQIVTERWYSPELQTVVMTKRSDPRVGETTFRLSNINRTEPAATLFQVPSDYTLEKAPGPAVVEFHPSTAESKP
jgi:hypothetical protein